MSSDTFFTDERDRGRKQREHEANAKRVCLSCPVLCHCRDYAVQAREPFGIWGATTPRERVALRGVEVPTASTA